MTTCKLTITLISAATLCVVTSLGYAQQWSGPGNQNGTIWRPGGLVVGGEPSRGEDTKAVLDVKIPADRLDDLAFRAGSLYKNDVVSHFEVDKSRAYAGRARTKASVLPGSYDFAVYGGAAIGVDTINEMIPSQYKLAVGGKILAEEVKIKLIKDWSDYVFAKDYQLKSLADVEEFIHANRHLPEIPSATEVKETGVSVGEMQSKLLLKIEELTLYLIRQQKTIEQLTDKLARLEQGKVPLKPTARR